MVFAEFIILICGKGEECKQSVVIILLNWSFQICVNLGNSKELVMRKLVFHNHEEKMAFARLKPNDFYMMNFININDFKEQMIIKDV